MKLLVTSDIHGNKDIIRNLAALYTQSDAELLLICGDIGGKGYAARTLMELSIKQKSDYDFLCRTLINISKPFYCILGNDDWFDVNDEHTLTVGQSPEKHPGIIAYDLVNITPFNTNREVNENKLQYELEKLNTTENSIILAHCPPYQCQDRIYRGDNVGSKSIRQHIHTRKPKFWLCGHIHEDSGVACLGTTTVINCACDHLHGLLRAYLIDTDEPEAARLIEKEAE